MKPEDISLDNINKLFEYEKHCRVIDELSEDELRTFSKLYLKLYLKQQEVISLFEYHK
jgi:hypothetical protein